MLIHGDCLIEMDKLIEQEVKIDLIVIDPPYDIKNTKAGGKSKFAKSIQGMNDELKDTGLNINLGVEWCRRIPLLQGKLNCYIWCNKEQIIQYLDYFVKDLGCSFDIICWRKTNAMPTFNNKYLSDKEYCLYFRKGGYCNPGSYTDAKTVFEQPINIKDKRLFGHPTIKPLNIIETIIRNSSREGELILDCFMGSGTTGVACKNLNRRFIGIELSEEYYEISKKRIEN